jgi:acyl-CoA synthetase (NDP forming)
VLEPGLEATNPLDAWGTGAASDEIYGECLLALDADPSTGLNLFAVDLFPLDDPVSEYPKLAETLHGRLHHPLAFLVHASGTASEPQMRRLRAAGIPVLMGTETGLRAAGHVLDYAAFQRARHAGSILRPTCCSGRATTCSRRSTSPG